jgi:hypothetical protein
LPARVHDLLDDGEQVKGRAGKLFDPRHCHHVAGDQEILAPPSALMVNRRRIEIKDSKYASWKMGTARRDLALLLKALRELLVSCRNL